MSRDNVFGTTGCFPKATLPHSLRPGAGSRNFHYGIVCRTIVCRALQRLCGLFGRRKPDRSGHVGREKSAVRACGCGRPGCRNQENRIPAAAENRGPDRLQAAIRADAWNRCAKYAAERFRKKTRFCRIVGMVRTPGALRGGCRPFGMPARSGRRHVCGPVQCGVFPVKVPFRVS